MKTLIIAVCLIAGTLAAVTVTLAALEEPVPQAELFDYPDAPPHHVDPAHTLLGAPPSFGRYFNPNPNAP